MMKKTVALVALMTVLSTASVFSQEKPSMPEPPKFSEMDTNGDGVITSDETRGPMERDFDQIDSDGDGKITEQELTDFMQSHRPPQRPQ